MLRTALRRSALLILAVPALLAPLAVATAPPAGAAPTPPKYSCPDAVVVGGTAPFVNSSNRMELFRNPGRCGQRIQTGTLLDLQRHTWEPRGKVILPDGRAVFEYQQYYEDKLRDHSGWHPRYTNGTVQVLIGLRCARHTAVRAFRGKQLANTYSPAIRLAFTVDLCWNGAHVWFRDEPEYRLYVGTALGNALQAACAAPSRTPVDATNTARRTSVYVTCNAQFSNRSVAAIRMRALVDSTGNSEFTVAGGLNAGINLGPVGSVSGEGPVTPTRYFTIRVNNNGCYGISGVGNGSLTCL